MNDREKKISWAKSSGWIGVILLLIFCVKAPNYIESVGIESNVDGFDISKIDLYDINCETCSNPERFVFEQNKIIPNDKWHLKIYYFPNVDVDLIEIINGRFEAFEEWSGFTFTPTNNIDDSDIRIDADEQRGAYSFIGNSIFRLPKDIPTMNIGFTDIRPIIHPMDPGKLIKTFRVIDHEIMHTLGVTHEQFNKNGGIDWIVDRVYAYFRRFGWTDSDIERNVLGNRVEDFTESEADALSIMLYYFPCELTRGNEFCERINRILSPLDSAWVRQYYPRESDEKQKCFTKSQWDQIFNN